MASQHYKGKGILHQSIKIKQCGAVSTLAPLAGAVHVVLEECPNIKSLAPLSNAKSVAVIRCAGEHDVTPLTALTFLTLTGLEVVVGVGMVNAGNTVQIVTDCGTILFFA
jgi:hypothetical protein